MLGEKLISFKLLFTKRALPWAFDFIFESFLWISYKLIYFFSKQCTILRYFFDFFSFIFSILLDLFEHCLSIWKFFIISFNSQENRSNLQGHDSFVLELIGSVVIEVVNGPQVQKNSVILFLKSRKFPTEQDILWNFCLSIQFLN